MRKTSFVLGWSAFISIVAACGSSGGGGGGGDGSCANVSGSWTLSGTCPDSSCAISQTGCSITLSCDSGTYTGSVTSSGISFSDPQGGSCSGSVAGKSANGSCTDSSGTCSWTATCQAGACGSSGSGGGGGSGGSSGVDCNSACNAIIACCPGMGLSDCLTGCAQNTSTPTCLACLNNTACGALGPCLVANCSVPASFCGG